MNTFMLTSLGIVSRAIRAGLLFGALFFTSCDQANQQPTAPTDTLSVVTPLPDVPGNKALDTFSEKKQDALPDANPLQAAIRLGKHNFTLHWISWKNPGFVMIEPSEDGWYQISGGQKGQGGDFITIEGGIRPITDKELQFRGRIEYFVKSISNDKPCVKEGEQVFKSTKGRKYWRLQNMLSCEGITTDYIDIYF